MSSTRVDRLAVVSALDIAALGGIDEVRSLSREWSFVPVETHAQHVLAEHEIEAVMPEDLLSGKPHMKFHWMAERLHEAILEIGPPPDPFKTWFENEHREWFRRDGAFKAVMWGAAISESLESRTQVLLPRTGVGLPDGSPWGAGSGAAAELIRTGRGVQFSVRQAQRRAGALRGKSLVSAVDVGLRIMTEIGVAAVQDRVHSPTGPIILALHHLEFARLSRVIGMIAADFPDSVQGRLLDRSVSPEIRRQPIHFRRFRGSGSIIRSSELERWTARLVDSAWGHMSAPARRIAVEHISRETSVRWGRYEAQVEDWRGTIRTSGTRLMICSTGRGHGHSWYSVPGEAAVRSGVPTITLPHAMKPLRATSGVNPLLWREAVAYDWSAWSASEIEFPTPDVLLHREYPAATVPSTGRRDPALNALVLTDSLLSSRATVAQAAAAVREISLPALFKGHPSEPVEVFRDAMNRGARFTQPSTDLFDLLSAADIVICADYIGSALMHAIDAELPVILFWRDFRLSAQWSKMQPELLDVFLSAGTLISSREQLECTLLRLTQDRSLLAEMAERSRFVKRRLHASDGNRLSDLISDRLSGVN